MDFSKVIEERYSCREYLDKKISEEELNKLLMAANLAPTAVNFQPFKVLVIENPEIITKLKEATKYTFNAKTILCVIHNQNESWHRYYDKKDFGTFDSAIVTTHIVLEATNIGLGTCIVCSMKEEEVKRILNLGDEYIVDSFITVGYPKEIKNHNKRKELNEIVEYYR